MDTASTDQVLQLERIVTDAKRLAIEYYKITKRPLGITGEIGEIEAARLLGLKLAEARQSGYDAIDPLTMKTYQVKTRCLMEGASRSQKLGAIKDKYAWDAVLVVMLDSHFEPLTIREAPRSSVIEALSVPGSNSRARGVLSVREFEKISNIKWKRP